MRLELLVLAGQAYLAQPFIPTVYPEYCSVDMQERGIPPISDSLPDGVDLDDVTMLQVQVVTRHGARTPYAKYTCWKDYQPKWDCDIVNLMQPEDVSYPLPAEGDGAVLFRKVYDALAGGNQLGGTCQTGQLIDAGYRQQAINGANLRDAYICSHSSCLFDTASLAEDAVPSGRAPTPSEMYFRSDDQQRTVMSGQVLLESMLDIEDGAILDWHTGDFSLDWMYPNLETCPRLKELQDAAYDSQEYASFFHESEEVASLNRTVTQAWEVDEVPWKDYQDCVMTTTCEGNPLPAGMDDDLLERSLAVSLFRNRFRLTYDAAAFARLAARNLIQLLRDNMSAAVGVDSGTPRTLSLVAGHDDTIMPLLAALASEAWDGSWTPYAGMLTFEVMEILGDFYFRLISDGAVLLVDGCDTEICSVDTFMATTKYVTETPVEDACVAETPPAPDDEPRTGPPEEYSVVVLIGFGVACFLIGLFTGMTPLTLWYKRITEYQSMGPDVPRADEAHRLNQTRESGSMGADDDGDEEMVSGRRYS